MSKTRILVVEDEAIVAEDIKAKLESLGYEVPAIVFNGEDAVRLAAELHPDLVLMDVRMPGAKDGVDAASAIRKTTDLPIVFLTAFTDKTTVERAKVTQPLGYVVKPFVEDDLHTTIEIALYRHSMEKKLRRSEEMFRSVVNNSSDLTILTDPQGRVIYVSPQCESVLGHPAAKFMGQIIPDIIHPDDQAKCRGMWERVARHGQRATEFEYRIIDAQGGVRWIAHSAIMMQIDGRPLGMQNTIRNITERRKTEDALKESEEIFRHFMEHSPIYVFFKDENIRSLRLSRNYEQMLGKPMNELIGKSMDDLFPSDLAKKMVADDIRIMKEGRSIGVEEELNGKTYWTLKFPIMIDGKPRFLSGYTIDVTERKQAEHALRESERRFRILSDATFEGIAVSDHGRLVDVSDQLAHMLGYEKSEMIGKGVMSFVAPLSRGIVEQHMQAGFEDSYENELTKKDGTVLSVETRARTLQSHGKTLRVTVIRDISARKLAEEREKELRAKLERAARMESLGVLAGGVAHDLNNILGPLMLLPEIIGDYLQRHGNQADADFPDAIEATQTLQESAQRAAAVVSDLVVMGRRGQYQRTQIDLNKVVQDLMAAKQVHALQARHPDVQIVTRLADGPVWCEGSEPRLVRVLANLVGNSAEAIDGQGDVIIRTGRRTYTEEYHGFELMPAGDYVTVEVMDTGCGMDEETLARIFEPFFSTKKPSERNGSGLGLSVVHGLVKDHAGFVDVKSKPGAGATFTVYLPAVKPGAESGVSAKASLPGGHERILVVDDEPGQQVLSRQQLKKLGYDVTVVSSGHEAVALFEAAVRKGPSSPFDLVIVDMIMKGLDGLATCKAVRSMFPAQKLLISSGHAPGEQADEAKDVGIEWLAKPFKGAELARTVRVVLDTRP